ncbi:MAG TPA: glycogen synthase GlgA [Gemmataceae bacterium]|jgi:starch synthase|nr:glycogen synthase GlgA [Gemmataceae bacterium]
MPEGAKYKLLLAASEVVGFAKTGGLADVAGSLPRALARRGHQCAIILPLYRGARTGPVHVAPTEHVFTVPIGPRTVRGRLWRSTLPDSDVPVYLVEQPEYYDRDDLAHGRGLYHFTLPNGQKRDYPDNCERYIFFSRAVLEALRLLDYWPDVVHNNDWQTGLVPVYLNEEYRRRAGYERIRTLFTIHNIAYQGIFWHWDMTLTGLDWKLFNYRQLEFHGRLNFLKAGIVFSDVLTTVSPRYAQEIQTPYYGCGLEGVLAERKANLFGIVNGVDYSAWNPASDRNLAATYDADSVTRGKPACKAALQRRYGLPEQPRTPLLGIVSRLAEQKGLNLVGKAADTFLQQDDTQLVVLGEGDPIYHRMLQDLKARHPDRVGITLAFDEPLAHQIEAGADVFLMPSLFEPSGLNQLYSLKYGTVPVVRATGGLADTITDCTPETLADGTATGFTFLAATPGALLDTVRRALRLYRGEPQKWLQLQQTGMRQDWSWSRSAAEYEKLYARIMTNP